MHNLTLVITEPMYIIVIQNRNTVLMLVQLIITHTAAVLLFW